jgi:hypothetical protein
MKHPRQSDLDRLLKAAVKAGLTRFAVALREIDGKVEPVLLYDAERPEVVPETPRLG